MSQPIGNSATWIAPHTTGGIVQGALPRSARNRAALAQPQAKKTATTRIPMAMGSTVARLATFLFIGSTAKRD
jgi:hypothetical protein